MSRKIFIDNLGPGTTRASLEELLRTQGKIETVEMPATPARSPVHAFVVMSTHSEASTVIRQFNNKQWKGFRLTVTYASDSSTGSGFSGANTLSERRNK